MPTHSKQFDLRSLFYLTSLVAVGAVVFAPVIRSVKTGQLSWVGLTLLEFAVFAAGCYWMELNNKNNRKSAGDTLFLASFRKQETRNRRREVFALLGTVFFVVAHGTAMYMMIDDSRFGATRFVMLVPQLMGLAQTGPVYFWNLMLGSDRYDLEVRENGLLTMFGFLPWDRVDSVRLSEFADDLIVLVVDHPSGKSTKTHKTPPETREALIDAIQKQLTHR